MKIEYIKPGLNSNNVDSEDEIVISGIGGRYPNSHDVAEFRYNLYNKIDMVDDSERRFKKRTEIPQRHGKVYNIDKFDASFFGCHNKLADAMHPAMRCLLEHSYEAILDAGLNPKDIAGTNTGVFSAVCELESAAKMSYVDSGNPYTLVGENRAMLANRISYMFDLRGPSFAVDSACSSAMMAVQCAYESIRKGECDACLVTGANLTLSPLMSLQFAK